MGSTLIIVAAASVAIGLGMSLWALGMAQTERRRSEARIALLEAELARDTAGDVPLPTTHTVAGDALTIEAVEERQTSRASPDFVQPLAPETAWEASRHELFGNASPQGGQLPRFATVVLLGALMLGSITAAVAIFEGAGEARTTAVTGQMDRPPLELTSLRHRREGAEWSVVGLVRNPDAGATIADVTAVTFLFDATGAFVASGRAPLDFESLAPGTESPFSVRVDTDERIARYRIGFRTTDGSVIRHVDLRGRAAPSSAPSPEEP